MNALKHGFYTRRIRKRDLSVSKIPTSRVSLKRSPSSASLRTVSSCSYCQRLVESADPSADLYELAGVLRTICLASATITRIIKAQSIIANDPSDFYRDVDEAPSGPDRDGR
jgi:hypothetical protein